MGMTFTFNGVSSGAIPFGQNSSFDLKIATAPMETAGAYSGELLIIDGVYGKQFPALNTYGNCSRDYAVSFVDEEGNLKAKIGVIRQWLYTFGYKRLTDDYDPNVYRRAACISAVDFELYENYFARTTISFDCDPRRFLLSGESQIVCTNGGNVQNDYMDSKPKIIISSSGAGTVSLGGSTISVLGAPGEDIVIDADSMVITNSAGNHNLSAYIGIANKFPELKHGTNAVSWNYGITGVKIIPNWWQP